MNEAAPWKGTLHVTDEQLSDLLRIRGVTRELIDAVLPSVEYCAYWCRQSRRSGSAVSSAARARAKRLGERAEVLERFAGLVESDVVANTLLLGRLFDRHNVAPSDARRAIAAMAACARDVAGIYREWEREEMPKRGRKADKFKRDLILSAASAWRESVGKPGTGERSPFVRFILAIDEHWLGGQLTREHVRAAVARELIRQNDGDA